MDVQLADHRARRRRPALRGWLSMPLHEQITRARPAIGGAADPGAGEAAG